MRPFTNICRSIEVRAGGLDSARAE